MTLAEPSAFRLLAPLPLPLPLPPPPAPATTTTRRRGRRGAGRTRRVWIRSHARDSIQGAWDELVDFHQILSCLITRTQLLKTGIRTTQEGAWHDGRSTLLRRRRAKHEPPPLRRLRESLLAHLAFVVSLVDRIRCALQKEINVTKEGGEAEDGVIARSTKSIRKTVDVDRQLSRAFLRPLIEKRVDRCRSAVSSTAQSRARR